MTNEEVEHILRTLPEIEANTDLFAATFYERFFEQWPETRELVTPDVTERNRLLVDEFIGIASLVSDLDAFVARAHELGARHRAQGAAREHYALVEPAIMSALAAVLGDRWCGATASAWHRLHQLMAETMLEGSTGAAFVPRKR